MKTDGKLSSPLWEHSMPDGLNAPKVMLLEQFEEAVDKAYPPQPAGSQKASQSQPSQQQPTQQQPTQQQPGTAQKP